MSVPFIPYPAFDITTMPVPITVASAAPAVSGQLVTGIGLISAITVRETSGSAAAAVKLHDGTDTTGNKLAVFSVPANGSAPFASGFPCIAFRNGIYLEVVSGAAEVTVSYAPYVYGFGGGGT